MTREQEQFILNLWDGLSSEDIRRQFNERFGRGINTITSFLQFGGVKLMDAKMIREWLDSEVFEREETKVHEGFIFDQEFNLR